MSKLSNLACFLFVLLAVGQAQEAQLDLMKYTTPNDITSEDIWERNLVLKAGVTNLTAEIYMDKIYNQKVGDKPWYICIAAHGVRTAYWQSTYVMKSLFFLQRDYADEANYAYIETTNELLRETFENNGIPQCIFVKDAKPYYAPWHRLNVGEIREFMANHSELKVDALRWL